MESLLALETDWFSEGLRAWTVQVVRELEGNPYHPGGSVFDDCIKGLKSVVCRFVEDHARGLTLVTCIRRL